MKKAINVKEVPRELLKNPINILIFLVAAVLLISAYTAISVGRLPQSISSDIAGLRQYPVTIQEFIDDFEELGMYKMKGPLALYEYERGNAVILDVRSDNLRQNGYIVESLHIPFPDLLDRLDEIPEDEIIIVYCEKNIKSSFATAFLELQGYFAYVLEDGIDAWIAAGGETTVQTPAPKKG